MSALSQHEVIPGSALTTVDTALPVDGSISPCAILTHCLGMMRHWSSTVNLGRPVPRDRAPSSARPDLSRPGWWPRRRTSR